jgi:hypothetical protein
MIAKKYPLLNFPQRNGFSKKKNVNLFAFCKMQLQTNDILHKFENRKQ